MKILIDAHTHPYTVNLETPSGKQYIIDISNTMIEHMDKNGIDKAIVASWGSPRPTISNEFISGIVAKHPDRLIGFGRWLWGIWNSEEAASQVEEAVKKFGLKGIGEIALFEFYPISPDQIHRDYKVCKILDKVAELSIPLLFHSGWVHIKNVGLRYLDPLIIDDIAAVYPDIPIIIAHAGKTYTYFHEAAIMTARKHDNIYLELSYQCNPKTIERLVNEIGAEKCMFGTDWGDSLVSPEKSARIYLDYHEKHLKAINEAKITEEDREQIFGKSIVGVLGL